MMAWTGSPYCQMARARVMEPMLPGQGDQGRPASLKAVVIGWLGQPARRAERHSCATGEFGSGPDQVIRKRYEVAGRSAAVVEINVCRRTPRIWHPGRLHESHDRELNPRCDHLGFTSIVTDHRA